MAPGCFCLRPRYLPQRAHFTQKATNIRVIPQLFFQTNFLKPRRAPSYISGTRSAPQNNAGTSAAVVFIGPLCHYLRARTAHFPIIHAAGSMMRFYQRNKSIYTFSSSLGPPGFAFFFFLPSSSPEFSSLTVRQPSRRSAARKAADFFFRSAISSNVSPIFIPMAREAGMSYT